MAIYHNEVKVITRGEGRSACAASAYISCSTIYNDYDGIRHDYTRKRGLIWEQVFLPPMAPTAWQDKEQLWNAVEAAEQSKDSRLAREHIVALPVELSADKWVSIVTDYIQTQFVEEGMCVHVAIHDTDGHNPHAHIMTTVRPLNQDGTWQNKTEKEYLCVRNGEERGFTAAEFKAAKNDGWEKQYPYRVGKKKIYMSMTEGDAHDYERTSKNPKSTRYGRQNPTTARWNSEEQLEKWRAAWGDTVNRYLEQAGRKERIDHRSNEARGIDEKPTVHEGVTARIIEQQGGISKICELNRQIRKDNLLIRDLKALINSLRTLATATVGEIVHKMEMLRGNIIEKFYSIAHNQRVKHTKQKTLDEKREKYSEYKVIHAERKQAASELRILENERNSISPLQFRKRREYDQKIDGMRSEVAVMKRREKSAKAWFGAEKSDDMKQVPMDIVKNQAEIQRLITLMADTEEMIEKDLGEYAELSQETAGYDTYQIAAVQMAIRPQIEEKVTATIENKTGEKVSSSDLVQSISKAEIKLKDADCTHREKECNRELRQGMEEDEWYAVY